MSNILDSFLDSLEEAALSVAYFFEEIIFLIRNFFKKLRLELTVLKYSFSFPLKKIIEIPGFRYISLMAIIIFIVKLPFNRYVYYSGILPSYSPAILHDNITISNLYNFLCHTLSEKRIDIFLSQIASTLTTVSVLSILSDKSKTIYWDNVVHRFLVKPVFFNFYMLSIYSFVSIALSLLAILIKNYALFGIFVFFNFFFLGCLSLKMIGVYFGDKQKKRKLQREFLHLCEVLQYSDKKSHGRRTNIHSPYYLMYEDAIRKYYDIIIQFIENTTKAIDSYDTDTAQDNINFLMENMFCFKREDVFNIISLYINERFVKILLMSLSNLRLFSDINDFYSGIYQKKREDRIETICIRYNIQNEIYRAIDRTQADGKSDGSGSSQAGKIPTVKLDELWFDVATYINDEVSKSDFAPKDHMIQEILKKSMNDIWVNLYYVHDNNISNIEEYTRTDSEPFVFIPVLNVWMDMQREVHPLALTSAQVNGFYANVKKYVKQNYEKKYND